MQMSKQWCDETIKLLQELITVEKNKLKSNHIHWSLNHGYEFGVLCTNCYWQGRHDEYDASPDFPFICPNCGETEYFTEFMVPMKRRFKFLDMPNDYPISIDISNGEKRLGFDGMV